MVTARQTQALPWQAEPPVRDAQQRTVRFLAAAQIIGGVGVGVASSLGPLLAESVAHSETLAGLARTATTAGAALVGVPLAFLAQRRGRRSALSAGWLAAAAGGVVLLVAAVLGSVPVLVVGMLLFGIGSATNQQSRYAAADLAAPHHRARALSIVVWSTTIGSVIGPNLADPGAAVASALHLPPLTGAFLLSTVCMALASLLLWTWLRPDPLILARQRLAAEAAPDAGASAAASAEGASGAPESLADTLRAVGAHLRRAPRAAVAFLTIVVANTVMGAVMTMTPVSMTRDGVTLAVVGITISGHLLGMYAFAPLVGWLADRFGHLPVVLTGQAVFLLSALSSGLSHGSTGLTMTGLFLLGLGWSFSLVAGSAMLSDATPAALRPGVQGTADTAMNVVAALGAGLAGPLMGMIGFGGLNALAAVLVLPVVVASLFLVRNLRRPSTHLPPTSPAP